MVSVKDCVLPIPLLTIDSATFNNTFQLLTTGLPQALFCLKIVNASGVAITVSYDGTNAHDYILAVDFALYNFQTNAQPNNWVALLAKGTPIYIKGAAPSVGLIWVSGWYSPVKGAL